MDNGKRPSPESQDYARLRKAKAAENRKNHALSRYNERIAEDLCSKIAGGMSLIRAAREVGLGSDRYVYYWAHANPVFMEKLCIAREMQCEHYAQEIIDLADTPRTGQITKTAEDGSRVIIERDNVRRTELMIDARKWYACHVHPKKFGRPDVEINNEIVTTVIVDF